jgi:release factor glutamine methyltransferase
MFGTPTAEIFGAAVKRLADAGVDSARTDARVLLTRVLGVPSDTVVGSRQIDENQLKAFEGLVSRRAAREPLAYITGVKEFFSLELEVGPGVLIPRPETETLVEEAAREFPDRDAPLEVVDLGTGSGCLLVAFLTQYGQARGVGIDASPEALAWARRNIERHRISERCSLSRGGWNSNGVFDVVFVNPPYLTEEEFSHAEPEIRRYEPEAAFVGGCDGLAAYRDLVPDIAGALKAEGLAFVEIGAGQAEAVSGLLRQAGLELRRIAADIAGISRCIIAGRPV